LLKTVIIKDNTVFINKAVLATLFTIVIALSMIGVNFAHANTKKVTTQDSLSSYPSIPITAGAEGTTDDNRSSDDGPPPAVLHKDEPNSATPNNTNSQDSYSPTVNSIPEKDLKNFSKCRANAALDGDVTPAEVMSCFHQGV
jgi:hypothetical protein